MRTGSGKRGFDDPVRAPCTMTMATRRLPYTSMGLPFSRATKTYSLGNNYSISILGCLHKRRMCPAVDCRFLC